MACDDCEVCDNCGDDKARRMGIRIDGGIFNLCLKCIIKISKDLEIAKEELSK